jgi:hypothetical protein
VIGSIVSSKVRKIWSCSFKIFEPSATASSGLSVTYTSSIGTVATVSGTTITVVGAGTTTITASQAGNANFYAATNSIQTLTVNKATLTVSGASVTAKTYDATTTATITGATLVGKVGSDVVTVSGGGNFVNANVGTGKSVTSSLTLGGANAGNYTLTQPSLTGNITALG